MTKFVVKIIFLFFLTMNISQNSFATDGSFASGAQSFDAFVSAGTQTALARDAGGVFVNPAAVEKPQGYLLTHSYAGYSSAAGRGGFHVQNSWSTLGFVWKPNLFEGRFLLAGGYYNPANREINHKIESKSLERYGASVWHADVRGGASSRRAGISASYETSPALQWGLTLSLADVEEDTVFKVGAVSNLGTEPYRIEYDSFTATRSAGKITTLDTIAGVRSQIMDSFYLGFSAELPLSVFSNERSTESSGLIYTKTQTGQSSPEANARHFQDKEAKKSLSQSRFPTLYRAGVAWQGEEWFLGADLRQSTTYRDLENEKYRSLTDWSFTSRYALSQAVAFQAGVRTDYGVVSASESLQGAGKFDVRLGLLVKVGNTRIGIGTSYGRIADRNVLDLSLPEAGRVVQGLLGMTSTF